MSFKNLNLIPELLQAIEKQGYTEPTQVQAQAIPIILGGSDLLAGSQTGTGKTAGFTLPMLQRLMARGKNQSRSVRALILAPTRELAAQIGESVRTYGEFLPFKSSVVFGGVNINPQIRELRQGVDVLIATPGRLLDHVSQKTVDLSKVEILVLDEADQMLDMGFIHDIKKVLAILPRERQNLLFSATFSNEIKQLANGLLKSPKQIEVAPQKSTADGISQVIHPVDSKRKKNLLSFLIKKDNWKQVLVFTRTKHGANRLAEHLEKEGIRAAAIHGNKSQGARTKALADFKEGSMRVLVATDIASRGLDIDQLPYVVNYELPNVPESYVHRIGRTGRAGKQGVAVSLVCIDEREFLRDIEKLLKKEIPKQVIEGYEPDPTIKAEPIIMGRSSFGRPQQGRGGPTHRNGPPRHGGGGHRPRG